MTRRQLSMTGSNNNSRRRREGSRSSRRSRSKCGKGAARQALKKVFALVYMKSKHTNKIYQEIYQKKDVNQKRSAAKNTQRAPAPPPAPGTALLQLKLLKIIARQSWLTACGRLWCLLFPLPLAPALSTCRCSRFAYTGNEHDAATSQFGFTALCSPPEEAQQATGRAPSPRGKQGKEALCGA